MSYHILQFSANETRLHFLVLASSVKLTSSDISGYVISLSDFFKFLTTAWGFARCCAGDGGVSIPAEERNLYQIPKDKVDFG